MISFKSYFAEALNRRQEYYIDREIHNAADYARDTEFSDHVFGGPSSGLGRHNDHDVKIIPFDASEYSKPPEILVNHLKTHGYKIHDWENRLAIRSDVPAGKKVNPIRIGKIMQKTEGTDNHYWASNSLKQHDLVAPFLNKGLEIMFTRHPYHVAEQSTNKGWRSCMALGTCPDEDRGFIGDMEDSDARRSEERAMEQARRLGRANQAPGENAHKVPDDILGGAHMAYLIQKGDYNLKRPLARISVKPYHSRDILTNQNNWYSENKSRYERGRENWSYARQVAHSTLHPFPVKDIPWSKLKPRHTILRPIGQTYRLHEFGAQHPLITKFENTLKDFTEKHFPMNPNEEDYLLDDIVQRDAREPKSIKNPTFGKTGMAKLRIVGDNPSGSSG